MGVQHPCQRAQGQTGDTTERVKWHSQTNDRTDTNTPRGNWERQDKNKDLGSRKYHRAGWSAVPPRAQCHCHHGYSQLLKGVQTPAVTT